MRERFTRVLYSLIFYNNRHFLYRLLSWCYLFLMLFLLHLILLCCLFDILQILILEQVIAILVESSL